MHLAGGQRNQVRHLEQRDGNTIVVHLAKVLLRAHESGNLKDKYPSPVVGDPRESICQVGCDPENICVFMVWPHQPTAREPPLFKGRPVWNFPCVHCQVDHVLPPDAGLELEKTLDAGREVGSLTRLLGSCVPVIPINWQRRSVQTQMWLDCVGRTKSLIGMRTYLIFRLLTAMNEHTSLSLCNPSSAGLDVRCRRHSLIFEAVSEVEIFLTTNLPGVALYNANDLWRENYLDPASKKLCFRGRREARATWEVS